MFDTQTKTVEKQRKMRTQTYQNVSNTKFLIGRAVQFRRNHMNELLLFGFWNILTTMETYRPQNLNTCVTIDVESDFQIESNQFLLLDNCFKRKT